MHHDLGPWLPDWVEPTHLDGQVGRPFQADPPLLWSEAQLADTGIGAGFDVAPDARLLALMPPAGLRRPQNARNVTLVLDCFSEVSGGRRSVDGPH